MGPASILILHLLTLRNEDEETISGDFGSGKAVMTTVQLMAVKGLTKGNIRPVSYGLIELKEGVQGRGEGLFRARFRPGALYSWHNAERLCLEVARNRYRFEVLFIGADPAEDRVRILCPGCNRYWNWDESHPGNPRQVSGRMCPKCRK